MFNFNFMILIFSHRPESAATILSAPAVKRSLVITYKTFHFGLQIPLGNRTRRSYLLICRSQRNNNCTRNWMFFAGRFLYSLSKQTLPSAKKRDALFTRACVHK